MKTTIRIKNESDLERMINAVAWEVVQADVFFKLNCDLRNSIPNYLAEINSSNTFWKLTLDGLLDSALIRLCRVFDPNKNASSLPSLLSAIRDNLHLFAEPNFRARMKGRGIEEWVLSKDNIPGNETIERDIGLVNTANPKVRDLVEWRGNIYAHRNWERAIRPEDFEHRPSPSYVDIGELLNLGLEIVNRYSVLFRFHSFSSQIVGHDDFNFVLNCVRGEVSRMKDAWEEGEDNVAESEVDGET